MVPFLSSKVLNGDYFTEFIKYEAQPEFSRIVITYETIRGHRGVDHFNGNVKKYEKKNRFHTRGRTGDFREITRVEKMDKQEIKTVIKISPPRGMGMGGAIPNCMVNVFCNDVLIHESGIGLNFNTNVNTNKIVIHVEECMTETFTSDEGSGISYNFWNSENFQTPVQFIDDSVQPSMSILSIWVEKDVELLLIDTEGKEDKDIREFKTLKPHDIKYIEFEKSFRCHCSNVEAVRFRINGGTQKLIAGKGPGNFRWNHSDKK